jgi:hypothetical protein
MDAAEFPARVGLALYTCRRDRSSIRNGTCTVLAGHGVCHGSISGTPQPMKSRVFFVAIATAPRNPAIAAI